MMCLPNICYLYIQAIFNNGLRFIYFIHYQ